MIVKMLAFVPRKLGHVLVSYDVHMNTKILYPFICFTNQYNVLHPLLSVQGSSKDCLILLIDCTQGMFTASGDGEVPFKLCMKVSYRSIMDSLVDPTPCTCQGLLTQYPAHFVKTQYPDVNLPYAAS